MTGLAAGRMMVAASLWLVACAAGGGGVSFDDAGPAGAGGFVPTGGVANPDAAGGGGPLSGGGTLSGGAGGAAGATGGMGSVAGTGVGASSGGGAPPDAGPDASSGGTDGGTYGDCCSVHSTPGCSVTSIEQCVCNIDPTCCSLGWNLKCIQTATQYQCAACPDGGVPGTGGTGGTTAGGNCCFAQPTAGCSNPAVQACVCAIDSYCCQYSWDSLCASEVVSEGCGTC